MKTPRPPTGGASLQSEKLGIVNLKNRVPDANRTFFENYTVNTAIVLNTLTRFHYSEFFLNHARRCFNELWAYIDQKPNSEMTLQRMQKWCKNSVSKSYVKMYLRFIDQLEDVYQYGRVHGSHLKLYRNLSSYYIDAVDAYINHTGENLSGRAIRHMKDCCTHFCCYIQYSDVNCFMDLNYSILEQYIVFLQESSIYIELSIISEFLNYLWEKGCCRKGFSLYLHFVPFGQIPMLEKLPEDRQAHIEELRKESLYFPPDEFLAAIFDFKEQLETARYSFKAINRSISYLNRFYLFTDMSGIGYDYRIIDILLCECGERLFKTGSGQARRTLEMFEDYTQAGGIIPENKWKRAPSRYDLLPEWCKHGLSLFLNAKKKEGDAPKTVMNYRSIGMKFCEFIISKGVKSYEDITPEIVKHFNLQDKHDSSRGKGKYNNTIFVFLEYLEIEKLVKPGICKAIPKCASGPVKIVKVLSNEETNCLKTFCSNASTPVQIRDAAIILLGLNTGMRPIDIVGLRKNDISLGELLIRFTQQKTGIPHVVSIDEDIANSIIRYIREVRQKNTGDDHLFLTLCAPYRPVKQNVCNASLRRAGISDASFRTLRKNFATERIRNGATVDEAAKDLGHSNSNSVHCYVALDDSRMRLCPLSLSETNLALKDGRYKNAK